MDLQGRGGEEALGHRVRLADVTSRLSPEGMRRGGSQPRGNSEKGENEKFWKQADGNSRGEQTRRETPQKRSDAASPSECLMGRLVFINVPRVCLSVRSHFLALPRIPQRVWALGSNRI